MKHAQAAAMILVGAAHQNIDWRRINSFNAVEKAVIHTQLGWLKASTHNSSIWQLADSLLTHICTGSMVP